MAERAALERHPDWVACINALGDNLGDGGRSMVSLEEKELLAAAAANTGLDDYGDSWFREPLAILLRALENEAELTLLGRVLCRSEVQRFLQNRLRIEDYWKRHPELADEVVEAPVFVCGLARTGTTLLHELLAQDPRNRVPMLWEMMFSVPPPETASYATDPRIAQAHRDIAMLDLIDPAFPAMHENAGDRPNECIFIFALQFLADFFVGQYNIPSYSIETAGLDLDPVYAYHKRVLQLLQSRHSGDRWVLKSPAHIARLDHLFSVYPDARVVVTHRDPLRVISSISSLFTSLRSMRSNAVRDSVAGSVFVQQMMLQVYLQLREELSVPSEQVVDVVYRDLVADPIGTVAGVYDRWGIPLTEEARERMEAYLRANPQGKHGAHTYSFEETGLDLSTERAKFAAYQAAFGVPSEV
ncbi:MAG: sulfotransferase [Myxococcota bacterium]|nr:sulfotransferase [Myxococcota bacterium]